MDVYVGAAGELATIGCSSTGPFDWMQRQECAEMRLSNSNEIKRFFAPQSEVSGPDQRDIDVSQSNLYERLH